MEDIVLSVKDLSVSFRDQSVLSEVSFDVRRGSTVAIIGPNGAGKSVLFRSLIGSVSYQGTVTWAPGAKVGYVPQRLDLDRHLSLTLSDFLLMKLRLSRVPVSKLHDIMALVHLPVTRLSARLTTLSGGEFQRALIAFALIGDPDVLLFDEPTAGIDVPGEEQIYETIHRLQDKRSLTVIIISHDLNLVARYATDVLCLNRALFCAGSPNVALKPEMLDKLYGVAMTHHIHLTHND